MMSTLINIAGKIDKPLVALYAQVSQIAEGLDTSYFVVGASARDIVLHHGYGAKIERATMDIDFGVQVSDWELSQASAHLLGQHSCAISQQETKQLIKNLFKGGLKALNTDTLIEEMCTNIETQYERSHQLLNAFFAGFNA